MKHALVFALLSLLLIWRAISLGGGYLVLLWPAISCFLVALAYFSLGSSVFGKRPDGSLAPWAILTLLPYLLLTWIVWHIRRLFHPTSAAHEIAPGLWLGRRPLPNDIPRDIGLLVDMTAEFPLHRALSRPSLDYQCVPTLDAAVGDDQTFRKLVETIASSNRPVYVHCALGYGRSASVIAAVLILKGIVPNVQAAEQFIRKIRPGVRLHPQQRAQLKRLFEHHKPTSITHASPKPPITPD